MLWRCTKYMHWSRHGRLSCGGSATPIEPSKPKRAEHARTISSLRRTYHVLFVKLGFHAPHLCLLIGSSELNGAHEGLPLRVIVEVIAIERHSNVGYRSLSATVRILIRWYYVNSGDECVRWSLTSVTLGNPMSAKESVQQSNCRI